MGYLDYEGLQVFKEENDATYAPLTVNSVSGNTVRITDGADNKAVKSYVVDIESSSAVSSVVITRAGKNFSESSNWIEKSYYNDSGNTASSNATKRDDNYIPCTAGESWSLTFAAEGTGKTRIHEYSANKTWLRQKINTTGTSHSWTVSSDAAFVRFSLPIDATNIKIWAVKTYTVTLSQSVTEGELDVTNGVLTVDGTDYEVDPVEIKTMYGENNFFANCGDSEIEYIPDADLHLMSSLLSTEGETW